MFEVLEGGIQTTVQDYPGRVGYLDLGTYPAGPMDHFAFRVANLLVGNAEGAAALEVTAGRPKARFQERRAVAITRGRMERPLNAQSVPLSGSVGLRADEVVQLKVVRRGGPQADHDYMTAEDMEFFFSHAWKVDRNSNRMGVRLESHKWQWARTSGGVAGGHPSNILDDGYAVWTVNVCGDQPIILVADGPSLGGFICNATLIYASTWKVGQLVPGRDTIRFKEVTIDQATQLAASVDETIAESSIERG